tara:strand:+ start:542 stop:2011 length:1470 start_codon:yes stop_codon:yes gene_type:complete
MNKLAIIVPYNENLIENFTEHLEYFFSKYEKGSNWYKICFIKQKSNRPTNYGKIFNIGFNLYKDKYDSFCFHEIDFIPLSDTCDYTENETPINLINGVDFVEFGEHQQIEDFSKFELPYDEYYGGVLLCRKEDFLNLNGFSNDYWGHGSYDLDFLNRLVLNEYPMITEVIKPLEKKFVTLNGINSYVEIKPSNKRLMNTTDKNFSISLWFKVDDFPIYGAEVDTNRCEYFLFGRSGYHTGISLTHDKKLKATIWNSERIPTNLKVDINEKNWNHVCLVNDNTRKLIKLYLNGNLVAHSNYDGKLFLYGNTNYYIGVGNPTANYWRNFTKGSISEVALWDDKLDEDEIKTIYNLGIVDKKYNYNITRPLLFFDFNNGYGDMMFDMSGNHNHGKFHNLDFAKKIVKTSTERYLPYRRKGYFGYINQNEIIRELYNLQRTKQKDILKNKKVLSKKLLKFDESVKKDGLNSTRFRIISRENFKDNHEIIEVML